MNDRTLIRQATVLSMDPAIGNLTDCDILVRGASIEAIGHRLACEAATVVEGAGTIVMPGFVNAHSHTWQFQLRGIGADWLVKDYFRHMHGNLATRYTAEDIYIGTLMGALNQLHGGSTTLVDWSHALRDAEMADAAIDALQDAGIRAVFVRGTAKPPEAPGQPPFHTVAYPRAELLRLRMGRLSSDDALVTLAMGILGPDIGDYQVALQDLHLAREFNLYSSAHAFGRTGDRRTERGYEQLAQAGMLGPTHNIAHGNCLDDAELKAILDTGCSITATNVAEMLITERPALLGRVVQQGGAPSLGSDVEAHFNGSMLAVARHAFLHQREHDNRSLALLGQWPPKIANATLARDALQWATVGGAKAFGLDGRTGTLAPGKAADLIVIDTTGQNMFPASGGDPLLEVLMHAENADIRDVMVAGRFRKRDGQLCMPPAVLEALRRRLENSRRQLFETCNFQPDAAPRGPQPASFA